MARDFIATFERDASIMNEELTMNEKLKMKNEETKLASRALFIFVSSFFIFHSSFPA
jgi:hypothetical protein